MVAEIVAEMDYLRAREQKLRDTNESTNTRVKWFGFGTTFLLIVLWGWQIMYLRAYFRWVNMPAFAVVSPREAVVANLFAPQIQAPHLKRPGGRWAVPRLALSRGRSFCELFHENCLRGRASLNYEVSVYCTWFVFLEGWPVWKIDLHTERPSPRSARMPDTCPIP